MQAIKKTLLVGAGVMTIGVGSLGVASAATTTATENSNGTLVQKIADKFGLKRSDVQAVFDQDRASHFADMQAKRTAALKQAVTGGKLTQAQADHITAAWAEIDKLHTEAGGPGSETKEQRTAIKTKMDELKTWLDAQNIDLRSIDGLGTRRGHGFGRHDGPEAPDDASSTTPSSTTSS